MRWFLVFTIIGHGIKLGPVAIIDEIALSVRSIFFPLLSRRSFRISNASFFWWCSLWFFLIQIVGFMSLFNLNNLRYMLLALSLMLLRRISFDRSSVNWVLCASFAYLLISIGINVIELLFDLDRFSWQNFLWTGTAYSSLGVFFAAIFIICSSKGEGLSVLAVLLFLCSAFLNDSRLSLFYFVPIMVILSVKHFSTANNFSSLFKRGLKLVFYISLIIIFLGVLLKGIAEKQIDFLIMTFSDVFYEDSDVRDTGRKDQIKSVYAFIQKENLFHALFGYGGFSHQVLLIPYVGADSTGIVRPVGIAAVVFDGGLLFLGLITLSMIECLWFIYKATRKICTPVHLQLAAFSLPLIAFLSLFVTNLLDSVLFWLCLSLEGLGQAFIERGK